MYKTLSTTIAVVQLLWVESHDKKIYLDGRATEADCKASVSLGQCNYATEHNI